MPHCGGLWGVGVRVGPGVLPLSGDPSSRCGEGWKVRRVHVCPGKGSVIGGPLVGTQLVGLWSCTPGCGVMGRDGVIGGPVGK